MMDQWRMWKINTKNTWDQAIQETDQDREQSFPSRDRKIDFVSTLDLEHVPSHLKGRNISQEQAVSGPKTYWPSYS